LAVYTHLASEDLAALIAAYDVGELISAKGIAEGVSNSNWLIETNGKDGAGTGGGGARFILTMYEKRTDADELPFFLGLLDHLAGRGCAVPATIHDRDGAAFRTLDGKALALIEYLPGISPDTPTRAQANAVGAALAQVHMAAADCDRTRANDLDVGACAAILDRCGETRLARIDPELPQWLPAARELAARWPQDLPRSIIHSDLFPDNVLMLGERVTGLIDFYFACEDMMAYDLAIAHAAWCFDRSGTKFAADVGQALVAGYESVRPLERSEREALPLLAQGACLRFTASRAQDWLDTPPDALVTRKDPMDFTRRWKYYAEHRNRVFA
tara:strand:+ start:6480 stop:7466 length:987 start_codon:yes stop_codon:yes gene_type:complete